MADSHSDTPSDRGVIEDAGVDAGSSRGAPRWVKAFAIIAVVLVVAVALLLLAGGGHGPGRHTGSGGGAGHTAPAAGHAP